MGGIPPTCHLGAKPHQPWLLAFLGWEGGNKTSDTPELYPLIAPTLFYVFHPTFPPKNPCRPVTARVSGMVASRWDVGGMWVGCGWNLWRVSKTRKPGGCQRPERLPVHFHCLALAVTAWHWLKQVFEGGKGGKEHQVQRSPAKKGARCRDSQAF